MTLVERTFRFALSLALMAGSMFLAGDGVRLMAEWRIDTLNGIFMLYAGVLAALVFASGASEAQYAWPVSITKTA